MSNEKTAVSAVHEYCAKKNWPHPSYEFIAEASQFVCEITVENIGRHIVLCERGIGRSKRDAKHNACTVIMKRLLENDPSVQDMTILEQVEMPSNDMIVTLRDFCVKYNHPLPVIEIIQQGGKPDAPEFIASCTLASIKRYGVSSKKKDARQKAAFEMYKVVSENTGVVQTEVACVDDAIIDVEAERYEKFKTYRELTDSNSTALPGVSISDRHNYFYKFFPHLKEEALKILQEDIEEGDDEKCMRALAALKIKPKITNIPMQEMDNYLMIDFGCEYDVVMAGPETEVYGQITEYLIEMLT